MKFTVGFKTPDAAEYALQDMNEEDRADAESVLDNYLRYGACVEIEFDTESGEANVVSRKW